MNGLRYYAAVTDKIHPTRTDLTTKIAMNHAMHKPSAFAAAEIRLENFINLEQFPIHDIANPRRAVLVEQCRRDLADSGCSYVPDFLLPDATTEMCAEANRLMVHARPADDRINPYLTPDDETLSTNHPKRFFETRTSSFINSDLLEEQSLLRQIYDSDVVVKFISDCLNVGQIFRWADPLGRNPYSVMKDDDYFPWHFDGNEFTVSMLVQEADEGGTFEYSPNIRNPENENFDDVKEVLQGGQDRVKKLQLKTGDLQLFKGRYSLHRVTKTRGKSRIIALPTYVTNPYLVNRPHHAKAFYGRATELHLERDINRIDNLTD